MCRSTRAMAVPNQATGCQRGRRFADDAVEGDGGGGGDTVRGSRRDEPVEQAAVEVGVDGVGEEVERGVEHAARAGAEERGEHGRVLEQAVDGGGQDGAVGDDLERTVGVGRTSRP